MDLSKLVQMIVNTFARTLVNRGIDYAARRGKPAQDMTAQEREQAKAGQQLAKRARDMAKLGRHIGLK